LKHKGATSGLVLGTRTNDRFTSYYATIYAAPRGELRKDLIRCLRQDHDGRRKRSQVEDRCSRLPDMVSIHEHPPEVEDCLIPGHWSADLIKGAGNRSAVTTLVERTRWPRAVLGFKMPIEVFAEHLDAVIESRHAVKH